MNQLPVLSWIDRMDWRLQILLLVLCLSIDVYLFVVCFLKNREPWYDVFFKIFGSNYFCLFILHRLHIQLGTYLQNPDAFSIWSWLNWTAVMLMFVFFMAAYVTRSNPVSRANRAREILYPLFCAALPFIIYESIDFYRYAIFKDHALLVALFKPFMDLPPGHWNVPSIVLIIGGHLISVWALIYLKRSFGILTEVRNLVTSGPYRYIRHPLYIGESIAVIGFCFYFPSWFNVAITLTFLVSQRIRAHFEEQKFLLAIPAYSEYMQRSGAYLPRPGKAAGNPQPL